MSIEIHNILGNRYGRLTVISRSAPHISPCGQSEAMWLCKCDCGKEKAVRSYSLKRGDTKSCGCYQSEKAYNRLIKHGLSLHPLFSVWCDMKSRCYTKDKPGYENYGGRGIVICDEWKNNVSEFVKWGEKNGHEVGLQIDREDNDGNYCPDNCRFVTRRVNVLNRRLIYKNNNSGYVGAFRHKEGKWVAEIQSKGVKHYLGLFNNKIDAAVARDSFVINNNTGHKLNFPQKNGVQYYGL